MDNLINLIIQAREEAIERGIQANSIVISDKLRYVKSFRFIDKFTDGSISMTTFKPMICGLEIDIKKLPANLDFVVYEADETFNGKLKAQIRKDTAKEILLRVVNICKNEEDFQDGTVNTQLEPLHFGIANGCAYVRGEVKELAKDYGVDTEELR